LRTKEQETRLTLHEHDNDDDDDDDDNCVVILYRMNQLEKIARQQNILQDLINGEMCCSFLHKIHYVSRLLRKSSSVDLVCFEGCLHL
jgi:hypothetical protein